MHLNIEIDDSLMAEAMRATGAKTKQEAVKLALETLVRLGQQAEIRGYRGKLPWSGDLNAMRQGRSEL